MMYQGSAAYQLDARQSMALPQRRTLSVYEGGRYDARNQRAVSLASFAPAFLVLVLALVILGGVRVALTAATVDSLRMIERAEMTVADEQETMTELKIERSALSNTDRIQRIATENYGMVYTSEVDTVTLDLEDGADSLAENETATSDAETAAA